MPDRLQDFAALWKAAAAVVEEVDLKTVLHRAVEAARAMTGARYAALGVIGEHGTIEEFIYSGLDAAAARAIGAPPVGKGILGKVIREATTIRLDHLAGHPAAAGFPAGHPAMDSFLGSPLRVGERVFGNFYLADKPGGFTVDDETNLEALATIAGSAVATARLHDRLQRLALVEERERIARDLHDSIIQDLFALGLTLQGMAQRAEQPEVRSKLDAAVDSLDHAIESLRRYVFGLRYTAPASFEMLVRKMVGDLAEHYPIPVSVAVRCEEGALSEEMGEEVLHMVKEAVSNALHHSESPNVALTIETLGRRLLINVVDNGRGFDPEGVSSGMGLANLRSRAKRLGGDVYIRSEWGVGTSVEVEIPI